MKRAFSAIAKFAGADAGQDLLEYAMLITLIAVAAIVVVTTVGSTIDNVFWQFIATNVAATL